MVAMTPAILEMLEQVRPYGVIGISLAGCVDGHAEGRQGAMRRSGHAHMGRDQRWSNWICFKAHTLEHVSKTLIWHEVGHIYRRSWTEAQVEAWARKQVYRRATQADTN